MPPVRADERAADSGVFVRCVRYIGHVITRPVMERYPIAEIVPGKVGIQD